MTLNGKQREFPAPLWAGVKRVRSAASLFLCIGTPYYSLEPTLSASQNLRTHIGVRRGVVRKTPSFVITKISDFRTRPGLCRALMKGQTPTDTPAGQQQMTSVAVALTVCSGIIGSTRVPTGTSAGEIESAIGRSAGFVPETTAKPRATAPVVLHAGVAVGMSHGR